MILYSIIPAEIVFQGNSYLDDVKFLEANYRGEKVMVSQMADKRYEITRLLSTRPGSFLDPAFQPGNVIDAMELKIME